MFNQSIWGKLKEFFTECLEALLDEFVAYHNFWCFDHDRWSHHTLL